MNTGPFDADSPRCNVHVLGVPLDHGAGRRGVSMGPSALRLAGLRTTLERLGCTVLDWGDVSIGIPEVEAVTDSRARYLPTVAACCQEIATDVEEILGRNAFPLVIGGDHSLSVGTISGVATHLSKAPAGPGRQAVIWFDAHGDINTPETSPSGNVHGMPVACLLGNGPPELTDIGFPGPKVEPLRFVQVGLRDIDRAEQDLLKRSGIHTFTMEQIDRRRIADVMEEVLSIVDGVDHLHVSFDIDVMDPSIAPGTGTPKNGGLTYREAHTALEMLAECGQLKSFEMVEVNPVLDHANKTAQLAVGLIGSALGERIL